VLFWPYNLDTDTLQEDMRVYVGDRTLTVEALREMPKALELTFKEITSPEAARELTNEELCVDRSALPVLDDNEYYLEELVGLEARDDKGTILGRIRAIVDAGAQTLLEVRRDSGPAVLVPANEHFIAAVVKGSHVVFTAPEGLF
jgi:16S rRNA processing protein RimM